jgi:hypothetical protein
MFLEKDAAELSLMEHAERGRRCSKIYLMRLGCPWLGTASLGHLRNKLLRHL